VIEKLQESFDLLVVCSVFDVHRSSFRYWKKCTHFVCPELIKTEVMIKAIFAEPGGSAGARSVATIAQTRDMPLSRYRENKIKQRLELHSCQLPKHAYKRGGNEHLDIPQSSE